MICVRRSEFMILSLLSLFLAQLCTASTMVKE